MATVATKTEVDATAEPKWFGFAPAEVTRMQRDDSQAGMTVFCILTAIIASGVVIILIGMMLSLRDWW